MNSNSHSLLESADVQDIFRIGLHLDNGLFLGFGLVAEDELCIEFGGTVDPADQ